MSLTFRATALVIVATPGTGAIYTVATGVSSGVRRAWVAAAGCTLGIVPHMIAAISGLAAIVHASATAFAAVKWAGVAYLLFLAWQTWRHGATAEDGSEAPVASAWAVVRRAVLIKLLNPKLTVFFFAFLPPFVRESGAPAWVQMVGLSAVVMAMTFVVFGAYGSASAALRKRVLSRPAIMTRLNRGFAVAYAALAGRLARATP